MSLKRPPDGKAQHGGEIVENCAWSLAQSRLFAAASEETIAAATTAFGLLLLPAATVIREQGDCEGRIYIVKRGRVVLRRRLDARVALPIAIVTAGDFFGEETLFEGCHTTASESLVETLLLTSAAADVRRLMQRSAVVAGNIAAALSERLNGTFAVLEGLSNEQFVSRVLTQLKALKPRYGVAVSDGTLLDIELAADDLAALVGASPAAVAKALTFLNRTRAIRINGTSITLLSDMPMLHLYESVDARDDIVSQSESALSGSVQRSNCCK